MRKVVLAFLVLGGCGRSYEVAKMGPDTYSVSAMASSGSVARGRAIGTAGQYCQGMAREVLVTNVASQDYPAGSADVTFRCLVTGDPALQRPSYEQGPSINVNVRAQR